jgi:3-dehydroquinate synthase
MDAPFSIQWTHRLRFSVNPFAKHDVLDTLCKELLPIKILVVVDDGLAESNQAFIDSLHAWCSRTEQVCASPLVVAGGEKTKNSFDTVDLILEAVNTYSICRKSCIIAIGGGAVLDAVGFAASIAHRGVPIIRMPSTSLSQGDSGVGVKNGINHFGKKNFIGTFNPPFAVVNDITLLKSLPDEHWRAGLSEAIKVALIKDSDLFDEITTNADALNNRDIKAMESVLKQSALLHLQHITNGGDPFETLESRPLDFGHWSAHKLEQLTDYEVSHGDAVAIGLSIDLLCSVKLGTLNEDIASRTISLLKQLGFPTMHTELSNPELLLGIEEFRQHLGGKLTLLMLKDMQEPVDIHELDASIVRQAIAELM